MSGTIGGVGSRSGEIDRDVEIQDDAGLVIGSDKDYWFGAEAGEALVALYNGGTQGQEGNEGVIQFLPGNDGGRSKLWVTSGEAAPANLYMFCDQGDDVRDRWYFHNETNGYLYLDCDNNAGTANIAFGPDGNGFADAVWNDNNWDYAEIFEWKTPLATDDAVKDLYGMSVVLDEGKVRIAEAGDEDNILGVVRAKGSTSCHGDGLRWQGKYIKNVWGEYEMENYTLVTWNEYLPNGNISYRHSYHKDEIPPYRLDNRARDKNAQLKESNFILDKEGEKIPVVVPSTDGEKTSSNYTERTTIKGSDKLLERRKFNPDYDESIEYVRREDRPKEWVLIGLLGQVPVKTSAIIPSHWKKFYNLESGVDKYYIYNK